MPKPIRHTSRRLKHFDYSLPGAYFVTIVAYRRSHVFDGGGVRPVVERAWSALPQHHAGCRVDAFVVMPNHVHGIVWIDDEDQRPSLGTIIGGFKSSVTRHLRRLELIQGSVWQPGFHDHVIRSVGSLGRIRQYITDNPARWPWDPENDTGHPDATEREFHALLREEQMDRGGLRT